MQLLWKHIQWILTDRFFRFKNFPMHIFDASKKVHTWFLVTFTNWRIGIRTFSIFFVKDRSNFWQFENKLFHICINTFIHFLLFYSFENVVFKCRKCTHKIIQWMALKCSKANPADCFCEMHHFERLLSC